MKVYISPSKTGRQRHVKREPNTFTRTAAIIKQLGIDQKEHAKQSKLNLLHKLQKHGLPLL